MKSENQPRFEFSQDESLNQKSTESENQPKQIQQEEEAEICSQCDVPLGTGTCDRCIRIRRQRGQEEIEPAPKSAKLINKAEYFRNRQVANLTKSEIEAMKERNREEVKRYQEKNKQFDANYRWLTSSEREELRKLATQDEKDAFLKKKLEERKNRSV